MERPNKKLRVLCLHGFRQNGQKLRSLTSAIRKAVKSKAEFVFLDGPVVVPPLQIRGEQNSDTTGDEPTETRSRQFSWWKSQAIVEAERATTAQVEKTSGRSSILEIDASTCLDSVRYIYDFIQKQGPFDGIFGFSQGGMIASYLLWEQNADQDQLPEHLQSLCMPSDLPSRPEKNLKFAIFVAAASSPLPSHKDAFEALKLRIPSLHIFGNTDEIVLPERSQALAECFKEPVIVRHEGGHYIPGTKPIRDALKSFLETVE